MHCRFAGSPREGAPHQIHSAGGAPRHRQAQPGARHLHRDRRQPLRPDRHQHRRQVPRQGGAHHADAPGAEGWEAAAAVRHLDRGRREDVAQEGAQDGQGKYLAKES